MLLIRTVVLIVVEIDVNLEGGMIRHDMRDAWLCRHMSPFLGWDNAKVRVAVDIAMDPFDDLDTVRAQGTKDGVACPVLQLDKRILAMGSAGEMRLRWMETVTTDCDRRHCCFVLE